MIDAKQIKENLSEDEVIKIVLSLGGELVNQTDEALIFTSITYKPDVYNHKPKLYYYIETLTFVEYHTGESFDIFELVRQRAKIFGYDYKFPRCLKYICKKIGLDYEYGVGNEFVRNDTYNWKADLNQYVKGKKEEAFDKKYPDSVLDQFDNLYHQSWIDDNISIETMDRYDIKYYKYRNAVVIPCRDIDNNIVGIRGRYFGLEDIKYLPIVTLNGTSYKFPTNQFLYGINRTKEGMAKHKKCLIVEAEKSVMQADTYFGDDNFTVGLYGKAFSDKKRDMILSQGVEEIIIGLDFDYLEVGDDDFKVFEENVYKIADTCKGYCTVSALVSYKRHKKKDSPTDNGKDFYLRLYKEREVVYQ